MRCNSGMVRNPKELYAPSIPWTASAAWWVRYTGATASAMTDHFGVLTAPQFSIGFCCVHPLCFPKRPKTDTLSFRSLGRSDPCRLLQLAISRFINIFLLLMLIQASENIPFPLCAQTLAFNCKTEDPIKKKKKKFRDLLTKGLRRP